MTAGTLNVVVVCIFVDDSPDVKDSLDINIRSIPVEDSPDV